MPGPDAETRSLEGRADRRLSLWLGVCAVLFFLPLARGHFSGSDELGVFATTEALYRHGTLATGGAGLAHDYPGRDGRRYSVFAPGQSVLALPFYGAGAALKTVVPADVLARAIGRDPAGLIDTVERPEIFFVSLYPAFAAGLLVALFFLLERRLGASTRSALVATLLLAATTSVTSQSTYFLRHTTEALLMLGALFAFVGYRQGATTRSLAWGVLLASSILLVRVPASVVGVALVGYVVFAVHARARDAGRPVPWAGVAMAILIPATLVAAVHVGVNQAKWGAWLASPMLDQSSGFTTPALVGVRGLLFWPGSSLFVYSPLLLLLPWTLPPFLRVHRAEGATLLAMSASILLLVSQFELWHGLPSAPGSRMVAALAPLLMLPLGPWLDRPRAHGMTLAVGVLALVGAAVQLGLSLARWAKVAIEMGYVGWEPAFGYLAEPASSPAVGGLRTVLGGGVDAWLFSLFNGLPGREPNPALGAVVIIFWAGLVALAVARLMRLLRSASD
ncbi:MAG: phospholipid carrier-dependent glycosyltransferase [Deltaproteobacteria bacterium]|nr:phospholipid carrier-dependent glycosyltransferase [Deltaproteobacteria bacterium]MBW2446983.1 phospholipid carrier-dependent glycosyltransferase [Deltaproteobacteria bacterium]